ncbi:hypothetical protein [Aquipuribacter hungaricus]|uniref:Uncharacterized protein n=1 Tax=Aquipuribacter hungaricus TaxID=545624 RepID=A0ABV7WKG2_9MICO
MGMLSRLVGQGRRAATTGTTARTGRPVRRGRGAPAPTPAARGLGGVARRLLGGGRRTGL